MIEPHPPFTNVDQRKGRARNLGRIDAKARGEALGKECLTGAEFSAQKQNRGLSELLSNLPPYFKCISRSTGYDFFTKSVGERGVGIRRRIVHRERSASPPALIKASPKLAVISEAIIARVPLLERAMSPASPCRYTAAIAAPRGSSFFWANNPAIRPVSTSPVPPVAMPELPVGLT